MQILNLNQVNNVKNNNNQCFDLVLANLELQIKNSSCSMVKEDIYPPELLGIKIAAGIDIQLQFVRPIKERYKFKKDGDY